MVFVGSGIQFAGTSVISTGSSAIEVISTTTIDDIQQSIPTSMDIEKINVTDLIPDMSTPKDEPPQQYEESFPGQMKV